MVPGVNYTAMFALASLIGVSQQTRVPSADERRLVYAKNEKNWSHLWRADVELGWVDECD